MKATHCFQRRKYVDKDNYSEARTFHQYTLVGIAAPDRDGVDIYRYFFRSTFKKGAEKKVSLFFSGFVRLFVLKCLMERTPGISFRREIENIVKEELFRSNKEGKEVGLLIEEAKMVGKALQQKYKNFFWKEKLTQQQIQSSFVQYAIKLSDIIRRQMAEIINQLKDNTSQIMQEEYVPQNMTPIEVIRAISANYESINRIDIMRHVRKTSLLKDLNALHSHSSLILRIPLVQSNRFEKQSGVIKVRYLSQETQPIMILLSDMAIHREVDWRNKQYREVWKKLVHSIITCCYKFHEQSDSYLPDLTAEDVYFDQKKLKAFLTYDKLILDGIGLLDPDTKNIECNLALALTPTFGQEKCYLQQEPRQKWLLKRKYHVRRVQGAEKDDQLVHLLQNIHVWRIIDLVFYMRESKHLSQFFYQQYYHSQKFSIKNFRQARRRMYDEMKEGSISVVNIFNIQQSYRNEQNEMAPFGFTLSEVRSIVGDNEQDSFIERLPVKRLQDYLLDRNQLFREIYDILLNDFFFRIFLNPKKYILLLLLSYFEEAHYLQTRRKVRGQDGIKLKQIVQKRKERIGQMSDRIRNYYNSTEGTANSKYVKSKYETLINKKLWPIDQLWSETLKKDDFVINQKQRLKEMKEDMGNDVEDIQNLEKSIKEQEKQLNQSFEQMMKDSYNAILDFMDKEIKPDLSKNIQTIHGKKVGGEFWDDYGRYLNKKLPILVTTILWLKYDNWLKFSCLLKNTLVEERGVTSRYNGIKNVNEVKYVQSKVVEIKKILEELKMKQRQ